MKEKTNEFDNYLLKTISPSLLRFVNVFESELNKQGKSYYIVSNSEDFNILTNNSIYNFQSISFDEIPNEKDINLKYGSLM